MQKQKEEALLSMFRRMDEEEQDFFLLSFNACVEGREKKRPALTLVLGGAGARPDNGLRRGLG
jgi:hypothetical protein